MRADQPSLTAAGVALARISMPRPAAPTGDPDAEVRLVAALAADDLRPTRREPTDRERRDGTTFRHFLVARTRFFDDAVLRAIAGGMRQIVILAAGYDGRALRFRTPGVQFFEVDHPATQRDKRSRLAEIDAVTDDITFVSADFTEPGLADRLTDAGYRRDVPALFTCEGLLRYLPEEAFRGLLRTAAEIAARGSVLTASISTRERDDALPDHEATRRHALERAGEPVLTVPPRQVALDWLIAAGWTVVSVDDVNDARPGRLLVRAERT